MRQQDWLFPHVFRKAGWLIVAVLSIFFLVLRSNAGQEYFDSYRNGRDYPLSWADYTDIIVNVFIIGFAIGLILIAFSKREARGRNDPKTQIASFTVECLRQLYRADSLLFTVLLDRFF